MATADQTEINWTTFGGPFLAYQNSVRDGLIAAGRYVSPEWFSTQMRRVGVAYDLGEPLDLCIQTLAMFALGATPPKTPLAMALRVVRF